MIRKADIIIHVFAFIIIQTPFDKKVQHKKRQNEK